MKILYLDATAGIAGDMTVAALLDLGLPLDYLQQELAKLGLPDNSFSLACERVERRGMSGCHFMAHLPHHHHGHHHHRSYADIRRMIANSDVTERAKELSQRIFLRLAEAEALAHNVAIDEVQFHEVGAVDSIVDIVGTAIGLDWLGVEQLYASALPLGSGFVETAHGRLPVPAPATAELLKGLEVHGHCGDGERVTPTGAAIVAALTSGSGKMPALKLEKIGYGAGTKDFSDCPNILRAFLGKVASGLAGDKVAEVRCNIDDVTAEVIGYTMERLLEQGALDCWVESIQMKKNRPGVLLAFICQPRQLDELAGLLMRETGVLGVRYQELDRITLERRAELHQTPWGQVRCKLSDHGLKPEYEDCRRIAREQGIPLRVVQRQAATGERSDL